MIRSLSSISTKPVRSDLAAAPSRSSVSMEPDVRKYFESRLGQDFSRVRVHTGEEAAAQAEGLGAKAFTIGNDIAFAEGRYNPGTTEGRRLLAHELTHVAQQSRGSAATTNAESRAHAAADQVSQGSTVSAEAQGGASAGVQCDDDEKKKDDVTPAPSSAPAATPSAAPGGPEQLPKYTPPFIPQGPSAGPTVDWLALSRIYSSRGSLMPDRDADAIMKTWDMNSRTLTTLGITDRFQFLGITKDWILRKGLEKQVEDLQIRENPNALDKANQEFKRAYPGGWATPIVPIFSKDF